MPTGTSLPESVIDVKADSEVEESCDMFAGNTGHGLTAAGNRKARLAVR